MYAANQVITLRFDPVSVVHLLAVGLSIAVFAISVRGVAEASHQRVCHALHSFFLPPVEPSR